MWVFYAPFAPYWIWNSLRSGSFSYFCKANPGMKFGGFLDYSKYEILKQIPTEFRPETTFLPHKNQLRSLPDFPFVAKPDTGERGVNVEVIRNLSDWENYIPEENLIIQEFIDLPVEFGVFYARLPGENAGKILSVTGKEFLKFESDGNGTLRDFIEKNTRASFRKKYLVHKFKNQLDIVYPKGKQILLEPIGNHNRGTKFYDASHLISDELTEKINAVSKEINGFYYGRFDVKSNSETEFQNGKFKILEINGSNSEPTHIYDPRFNLFEAYREVRYHLNIQFRISQKNPPNGSDAEFFKAVWKRF